MGPGPADLNGNLSPPRPYTPYTLQNIQARASPSTSSPTFNCPLPRLRRPPADLNAATTDKDCYPSGSRSSVVGQRTMGPGPADLNAATTDKDCDPSGERRAARRPTDYGARARAGGTCRVTVLHAASVIGCWGCATGAASLRTAPDAPPPTPDDASRIQNTHKTPTQLPTYNNASRTRRTPPTPDDASRMQYSHTTRARATSPGPGPIVYSFLYM